jgi:plasmid maintenance system antidote protein VapI
VKVTHQAVTKMFGGNRSLTATTIMRLEPYVGSGTCAATTP